MASKIKSILLLVIITPLAWALFEAECIGKDFQLIPHPTICSSYVACLPAAPVAYDCPAGYVYHPTLFTCVITYQCAAGTLQETFEQVMCRQNSGRLFINPENCSQYIDCRQVPPQIRNCGANQIFSVAYSKCLNGNLEDCSLPAITQSICQGVPIDSTIAHPYACDQYITCASTGMQSHQCLPGFIYNQLSLQCVAGNPLNCV